MIFVFALVDPSDLVETICFAYCFKMTWKIIQNHMIMLSFMKYDDSHCLLVFDDIVMFNVRLRYEKGNRTKFQNSQKMRISIWFYLKKVPSL